MTQLSIPQAIDLALKHQQSGRAAEAFDLVSRVVAADPNHFQALSILSGMLYESGRFDEAIAACSRAVHLRPANALAHSNLSLLLESGGRIDEAIASAKKAISLKPDLSAAYNHLGIALVKKGQLSEAAEAFARAISLDSNQVQAMGNLCSTLRTLGRLDEAIALAHRAIAIRPDFAEAYNHLAVALWDKQEHSQAIAAVSRAIELKGDYAEAFNNLGNILSDVSRFDEASAAYQRAIELKPNLSDIHRNLGGAYKQQARIAEAIDCWRRAIALNPSDIKAHSSLVFSLHYLPQYDARAILAEHRAWAEKFEKPLENQRLHDAEARRFGRRLKLGYISPDFRDHPVGRQLAPLLAHHDHQQFEIFCYSDVRKPDALTHRLHGYADHWLDTSAISDQSLAEQVRRDGIDILIDTTLHTENNRLLVFARKPAPIQVTCFGYPSTTGLSAIDYRLTDPYLDPPAEQRDELYSERSIRLRDSFWCFEAPGDSPEVNDLPAQLAGHLTFGCLNNFSKVSPATLALWLRVLGRLPDSRLILRCPPGRPREVVARALGPAAERVEFVDTLKPAEYFRLFHRIDICLDPFPYPGHTSSIDALWMGVPSITLAGETAVSRGGASILTNAGLEEFIANTDDQYVQIAARCSSDIPSLAKVRAKLRARLERSPLTDAAGFARGFEGVYKAMRAGK